MVPNLYHHIVVEPSQTLGGPFELVNISKFPEEFKKRFADRVFYSDVEYNDIISVAAKKQGVTSEEFLNAFDHFLTQEGIAHFCLKGIENPWADPKTFSIPLIEALSYAVSDPHVIVKNVGFMRGCLNHKFFQQFDSFEIVTDAKVVSEIFNLCEGPECVEAFIDNFIINWTDNSFIQIDY